MLKVIVVVFTLLVGALPKDAVSYAIRLDEKMRCPAVENQLGQLLYINVDGFGKGLEQAIHPDYIKLVKLLNIGGVVPQFGKRNIKAMFAATGELFDSTELPLLIGSEYLKIDYLGAFGQQRINAGNKAGRCDGQHDAMDSYLFKAVGINHWLGPSATAQRNPQQAQAISMYAGMGIFSTLRLPIPKDNHINPIVMTHHRVDKRIDKDNIVTLSRKWLRKFNDDTHFSGLLMTDAVHRATDGTAKSGDYSVFAADWLKRHPQDQPKAVFVARALLAGHNMVYLQGVARDTLNIYQQLSMMACRDDVDGRRLQYAIAESFHKISQFKRAHRGALSYRPRMDEKLVQDVLDYKYRLGANQCLIDDKGAYSSLRERIMLAR